MYFNQNAENRIKKKRSIAQFILDRLFFPIICLLSPEATQKFGLTPLDEERMIYAYKYLKGRVLDIGCGDNILIKSYGNGVGVDVYPWDGVDIVVSDTANLPFENESFDTVTFLASLNHIANREKVLNEAHRVLRSKGILIISMINPFVSFIAYKVRFKYDPDQHERGVGKGEVYGFWKSDLKKMLKETNFLLIKIQTFLFCFNNLYLAEKK